MARCARFVLLTLLVVAAEGCGPSFSAKARNGIVFYAPGAGNVDFGDAGIRAGLESAGWKGEVASFMWTISFNPAIDQTLRFNAHLRAAQLSDYIENYIDRYPGKPIHLIGLSAGTGVVTWALEDLGAKYKVDNVVLLGSSLWHRYDLAKALRHVNGKVYNYYSSNDAILAGPMKIFGSIDGVFGDDGAGAVGFHGREYGDKVVNIRWRPEFQNYENFGGHVDGTHAPFVRAFVAKHIVTESPSPEETPPPRVAGATAQSADASPR